MVILPHDLRFTPVTIAVSGGVGLEFCPVVGGGVWSAVVSCGVEAFGDVEVTVVEACCSLG